METVSVFHPKPVCTAPHTSCSLGGVLRQGRVARVTVVKLWVLWRCILRSTVAHCQTASFSLRKIVLIFGSCLSHQGLAKSDRNAKIKLLLSFHDD